MRKPIPTKAHGVLDYLSDGALCALPRVLHWEPGATQLLTGAAAATLIYSALTCYELGLVKVLPMPLHLALDGGSGALLCGVALLSLREARMQTRAGLVGIGLLEIAAATLTRAAPGTA